MIKGKQAVLDYFDSMNTENDHSYIHFSIFKRGTVEKGYACISTPAKEGWDYQQARAFLDRWLAIQQYGEFTLVLNDSAAISRRGALKQDFNIQADAAQPVTSINGPVASPEDIEARVNTKVLEILDRREKEKELADTKAKVIELTKEMKELEKKANDPWTKLISGIEPYVPNILQDMGIIKTRVAGIPNSTATPVGEDISGADDDDKVNQERLEKALGKIAQARPDDWLELLEKLAAKVEADPSLADKLKMFL